MNSTKYLVLLIGMKRDSKQLIEQKDPCSISLTTPSLFSHLFYYNPPPTLARKLRTLTKLWVVPRLLLLLLLPHSSQQLAVSRPKSRTMDWKIAVTSTAQSLSQTPTASIQTEAPQPPWQLPARQRNIKSERAGQSPAWRCTLQLSSPCSGTHLIQPRLLHTKVDNAPVKAIVDIQHFLNSWAE